MARAAGLGSCGLQVRAPGHLDRLEQEPTVAAVSLCRQQPASAFWGLAADLGASDRTRRDETPGPPHRVAPNSPRWSPVGLAFALVPTAVDVDVLGTADPTPARAWSPWPEAAESG